MWSSCSSGTLIVLGIGDSVVFQSAVVYVSHFAFCFAIGVCSAGQSYVACSCHTGVKILALQEMDGETAAAMQLCVCVLCCYGCDFHVTGAVEVDACVVAFEVFDVHVSGTIERNAGIDSCKAVYIKIS